MLYEFKVIIKATNSFSKLQNSTYIISQRRAIIVNMNRNIVTNKSHAEKQQWANTIQ